MQVDVKELKRLAHQIHHLSIKQDQDEHLELGMDVYWENYEDLQVVAHELADKVLAIPKARAERNQIIAYLEGRIKRLEKDCPSICADCPPSKVLENIGPNWDIHFAARAELRAAIREIKDGKHE